MASNFFNKASLVMVPDAPIDGELPSVKPEDRSGDFTFSRGSNLAATRVNKGGLIEKGRENLLLQSNQFDTTWYNTTSAETGGQIGYDGSNDAWELSISAAAGRLTQLISLGGVQTFSVYAKAGTYNFLDLYAIGNVAHSAYFDLSTGSVGTTFSLIDSSITSVGNGWYKCSITFSDTTLNVRFYPAVADNDLTGTSGSIYIQDAQLEQGLGATGYIETTTATVQKGILENLPRIDYSGGGSCPSLLLEPQRSNLFTQSEYFNSSDWVKTNVTATNNSAISPDGLQNATLINDGTASATQHWFYQPITLSSGTTYTISFYAKYVDRKNMFINIYNGATSNFVFYDIQNGVVLNGDGNAVRDIVDVGSGWYRITYTRTIVSSGANFRIGMANDTPIQTYTGENKEALIYGLQAEVGSYPTSYIPAYGSSVTRAGDNTGTIDVSSLGVTTGYTLFYELGDFNVAFGGVWLAQSGGSNRAYQVYGATAVIKTNSGDVYPFNHGTSGEGTGIKVAVNYDGTNINVFTNGTKRGTWAASKTIWDSLTNLDMNLSSVQMVNWKQLLVFPTALTDDECIALTTI